jgi:hypothetical protein
MAQDQYDELHPAPDDGVPVDYNPFHEETMEAHLERAAIAIEKLTKAVISSTDRLCAAINKQTKSNIEQTEAIMARREVVRDESGKMRAMKVVH